MVNQESELGVQHYACLYAWLSGNFARELNDVQVAELTSPSLVAWLKLLEPILTLQQPVNQFNQCVAALQQRPDARLELAADFAGLLFLMTGKSAALPYASCYQPEVSRFKQEQNERMKTLLEQSGLAVEGSFAEPEDHLALILELLSHLSFELTQARVSRKRLLELRSEVLAYCLSWLPEFNQRCICYDSFGFYAALSALLLAIIRLDTNSASHFGCK